MKVSADHATPVGMDFRQGLVAVFLRDDRIINRVDRRNLVFIENLLDPMNGAHRLNGGIVSGEPSAPVKLFFGVDDYDQSRLLTGRGDAIIRWFWIQQGRLPYILM